MNKNLKFPHYWQFRANEFHANFDDVTLPFSIKCTKGIWTVKDSKLSKKETEKWIKALWGDVEVIFHA